MDEPRALNAPLSDSSAPIVTWFEHPPDPAVVAAGVLLLDEQADASAATATSAAAPLRDLFA
jgi:hypothetical protein